MLEKTRARTCARTAPTKSAIKPIPAARPSRCTPRSPRRRPAPREFEGRQVGHRSCRESNLHGVGQHERCPRVVRDRDECVRDDAGNSGDEQYGAHGRHAPTTADRLCWNRRSYDAADRVLRLSGLRQPHQRIRRCLLPLEGPDEVRPRLTGERLADHVLGYCGPEIGTHPLKHEAVLRREDVSRALMVLLRPVDPVPTGRVRPA